MDDRKAARIALLKKDLEDCRNPAILAKYPHLGNPALVVQIQREIARLERTPEKGAIL
jgi:hypothetical protein